MLEQRLRGQGVAAAPILEIVLFFFMGKALGNQSELLASQK